MVVMPLTLKALVPSTLNAMLLPRLKCHDAIDSDGSTALSSTLKAVMPSELNVAMPSTRNAVMPPMLNAGTAIVDEGHYAIGAERCTVLSRPTAY